MPAQAPSSLTMASSPAIPTGKTNQPATTTAEVLRKAVTLLVEDEKLFLRVFLLVLSPFSLLALLHYLLAAPLMHRLEERYESSSPDLRDTICLVFIEVPFLVAFSLVWLVGTSVTIFSSARMLESKSTSGTDLLLWVLPSTWRKPIITWLYIFLLMVSYIVIFLASTKLMALIGSKNASSICTWLAGGAFAATYPYFDSVLTLGLVISVLEDDDSYGSKAIAKAGNLMRGRTINGYLLMLILDVLSIPISILFYLTIADDEDEIGTVGRFTFMFLATALFCLTKLFNFVVFTVFYFDCKQTNSGENVWLGSGTGHWV